MTNKINTEQIINSRNVKFDIAKGICIILIIVYHAEMPYNQIFSLFFVSVFFIISGYFFKPSYCNDFESLKIYIKKKFKTLVLPFIICNGIFILSYCIQVNIDAFLNSNIPNQPPPLSWQEIFLHFTNVLLLAERAPVLGEATWFLKVLFFISTGYALLFFFLSKKLNLPEKSANLIILTLCLICSVIGYLLQLNQINAYHTGSIFSCIFLYYWGILYKKYEHHISVNIFGLIAAAVILLIESHFCFIDLQKNEYTNIIHLWISAAAGAYFVFGISAYTASKLHITAKFLSYTGRHTIALLCLHFLAFKFISLLQIQIYNLPTNGLRGSVLYTDNGWWAAYIVAGIIIPLLLNEMYTNIKAKLFKRQPL